MGDTRFWFEERLGEQKEKAPTKEVLDLIALFKSLSVEDKISAKKLINKEKLL
jgi:hypothetical protein